MLSTRWKYCWCIQRVHTIAVDSCIRCESCQSFVDKVSWFWRQLHQRSPVRPHSGMNLRARLLLFVLIRWGVRKIAQSVSLLKTAYARKWVYYWLHIYSVHTDVVVLRAFSNLQDFRYNVLLLCVPVVCSASKQYSSAMHTVTGSISVLYMSVLRMFHLRFCDWTQQRDSHTLN